MNAQSVGDRDAPGSRLASMGMTGQLVDEIVDALPDPLFFLARSGDILHANRAACALAGSTLPRIVGRPVHEVLAMSPFDNAVIAEAFARNVTVSGTRTVKDGRKVLLSARPVVVGDGRIVVLAVTSGSAVVARGQESGVTQDRHGDDRPPLETDDGLPATIVVTSRSLSAVRARAERCAAVDSPVLLLGEMGTGKSLFAKLIHHASRRRHHPFKTIHCSAIPPARMETELFGRAGDVSLGADAPGTPGVLERAHRGTLVLDEVSELPPALQVKLLRFLETGDAWPIGASRPGRPDVRIIATTGQDLRHMVAQHTFRRELFYRLGVLVIHTPPLREHPEDIPPLVEMMLDRLAARHGLRKRVTPAALDLMKCRPFPGNVRELWNVIERLVLAVPEGVIDVGDVSADDIEPPLPSAAQLVGGERIDLRKVLRDVEAGILREALRRFGTQTRVARHLGVAQATIARKSKQYGLTA